jgi:hypothetical protein
MRIPHSVADARRARRSGRAKVERPDAVAPARLKIDFAARAEALSAMRGVARTDEAPVTNDVLATRLAWPRDVLFAQAGVLAARGMPIAFVYASAAATSVDRAIRAIQRAEQQDDWAADDMEGFRAGNLADWL